MHLGANSVDQPIECAECRQIDRRDLQRFNRTVDEIGGIAHRFRSFPRGVITSRSAVSS
jgi:hypothetical protein